MSVFKRDGEWIPSSLAGVWCLILGSGVLLLWLVQQAGYLRPEGEHLAWWPAMLMALFCYAIGGKLIASQHEDIWSALTRWLPQSGNRPPEDE